jgi:hypothetical protein
MTMTDLLCLWLRSIEGDLFLLGADQGTLALCRKIRDGVEEMGVQKTPPEVPL